MPNRALRQKAQAHIRHNRLLDGLVARHFHKYLHLRPMLVKTALHRRTRPRATFAHDERVFAQQFVADIFFARERVRRRTNEGLRIAGEWLAHIYGRIGNAP